FIAILCFFSVWWYASSKGAVSCKGLLNSFPDGQAFYGAPANYTVAVKFKY
ncbi:hypothetical protein, partial [Acinetobacter baumannii]|uniref:hypothetical protein n=1 Tax=Acinetobacter baumannii TaxID=470 RepID=UPI0038B4373D